MRWQGRRESENVEDRRSMRPAGIAIGGLGSLILIILFLVLGGDPQALIQQQQQPGGGNLPDAGAPVNPAQEELRKFVAVVLADTEDVWNEQFAKLNRRYQEPKLVLFNGEVRSACGFATSAVGPFYCPPDQRVYLDLGFFDEMKHKFRAAGDFAQAYVIAHEVGHHVQNLLGISDQVHQRQRTMNQRDANRLSVRLELQADFLAGIWAHSAQMKFKILEPGDLEEAIRAAAAIGDDRLQKQGQGYVVPDSFTHGTSEQRIRWFRRGFETGRIENMDELFELDYEQL